MAKVPGAILLLNPVSLRARTPAPRRARSTVDLRTPQAEARGVDEGLGCESLACQSSLI